MPCSDQAWGNHRVRYSCKFDRGFLNLKSCLLVWLTWIITTANHISMNPEPKDFYVTWLQQMDQRDAESDNIKMLSGKKPEFMLPQVCRWDNKQTIFALLRNISKTYKVAWHSHLLPSMEASSLSCLSTSRGVILLLWMSTNSRN